MKLISMTDFVLEQSKSVNHPTTVNKIISYANFLKQPLEIWMFVPCDNGGSVLKIPKWEDYNEETNGMYNAMNIYAEAKKRCLFKGFRISENKYYLAIKWDGNREMLVDYFKKMTIEDLVKYNLQLTIKF